MIVFTFDYETHHSDGHLLERPQYFVISTEVLDKDKEHEQEIYEQLDAQMCGLADL